MTSTLRPLRIAHVGHYRPHSADGVCQSMVRLVQDLRAFEADVSVWDFDSECREVYAESVDGVRVIHLPMSRRRWMRGLHEPTLIRRKLRELAAATDLIHIHSVFTPHNIWASKSRTPYVLTPHGGYSPRVISGRNWLMKKLWIACFERSLWSRAAALHATNEQEARDLRSLPGAAPVVTVMNGVDVEPRCPVHASGDRCLYLGRLAVEQKGIDIILQGYAIARSKRGADVPRLEVAGPSVNDSERVISRLIDENELAGLVTISPAVFGEQKAQLVRAAKIFVHPSRWEGMPVSVLEAMAAATPVIVTPETNLADFVQKYDAGWVCQATPESFAHAVVLASECPAEILAKKGANAHRCATEQFSRTRVAAEMVNLYDSVLTASKERVQKG